MIHPDFEATSDQIDYETVNETYSDAKISSPSIDKGPESTESFVLPPHLAAKEAELLRKQAQRRTAPSAGHISMHRNSQ